MVNELNKYQLEEIEDTKNKIKNFEDYRMEHEVYKFLVERLKDNPLFTIN